jgi:hypothetical protein
MSRCVLDAVEPWTVSTACREDEEAEDPAGIGKPRGQFLPESIPSASPGLLSPARGWLSFPTTAPSVESLIPGGLATSVCLLPVAAARELVESSRFVLSFATYLVVAWFVRWSRGGARRRCCWSRGLSSRGTVERALLLLLLLPVQKVRFLRRDPLEPPEPLGALTPVSARGAVVESRLSPLRRRLSPVRDPAAFAAGMGTR